LCHDNADGYPLSDFMAEIKKIGYPAVELWSRAPILENFWRKPTAAISAS